jgi:hypothetical protein
MHAADGRCIVTFAGPTLLFRSHVMTGDLASIQAEHRHAVAAFVAAARAVPARAWNQPTAPGKWSPAQIAEHVRLAYAAFDAELAGGQGLRLRSSWWIRPFLRLVYLRSIVRTGRMPRPVVAPREARPGAGPFDQQATLAGFEANVAAVEQKLTMRHGTRAPVLTHPYFGGLDVTHAWRFLTVHTDHHRRQFAGGDAPV